MPASMSNFELRHCPSTCRTQSPSSGMSSKRLDRTRGICTCGCLNSIDTRRRCRIEPAICSHLGGVEFGMEKCFRWSTLSPPEDQSSVAVLPSSIFSDLTKKSNSEDVLLESDVSNEKRSSYFLSARGCPAKRRTAGSEYFDQWYSGVEVCTSDGGGLSLFLSDRMIQKLVLPENSILREMISGKSLHIQCQFWIDSFNPPLHGNLFLCVSRSKAP